MKTIKEISSIGENNTFISFNAHCWFAFSLIIGCSRWLYYKDLIVVSIIIFAFKEYVFDMLYEESPPQTWLDSTQDFAGYITGTCLASIWIITL
ncbi:MAG: hypothetical protein ACREQ5_14290 [Candidatus Dormibacteria bacterium]